LRDARNRSVPPALRAYADNHQTNRGMEYEKVTGYRAGGR
jgi:hypothetical protein